MKKIWLGIGAVIIVVLLLLETKFNTYMRVEDSGFAILDNTVKQMLMGDPDEERESLKLPFYRFEALDYIYSKGNSFYMGEKKKTKVDLGFPLYINDGAGIMFTESSGTLFDLNFEEAEAYPGLMISERISYNQGGERADATEYLFYRIGNGLFMNLDTIAYEEKGEPRQIAMNSIICFREKYFTYCEPDGEYGTYQICRNIRSTDILIINEEEYTYRELLLKLGIISPESSKKEDKKIEEEKEEPIIPLTETENAEEEQPEEKQNKKEKKNEQIKKAKKPAAQSSPQTAHPSPGQDKRPGNRPSRPSGGNGNNQVSPGVRPPEMRPDKKPPTEEEDPPPIEYKKPEVKVLSTQEGVYRLMVTIKVEDAARRLHPLRKVQFEFYEIDSKGKETLAFRTYTGSSQTVTAGNGAIKPDTQYRVNAYFTYYDEHDEIVVESLMDQTMKTKPRDSLESISLADRSIDIYYDNRVEIPGVHYVKETSDAEAVYGIDRSQGIILTVMGKGAQLGFQSKTNIEPTEIRNFKSGIEVLLKSVPNLKANSEYSYKLEAIDYFGNQLNLLNNTGSFVTCKSRPIGSLEVVENKIGNLRMQVNMTDPDLSAVPGDNAGNYNIYLAFSTEKNIDKNPITKSECDKFLTNGGQTAGKRIHYVHRFSEDEYKKYIGGSGGEFKIDIDKIVKAEKLELNKKYYAYLFCDYNLNNGNGIVEFGEISSLAFTSASLSSLGDIYVKADISNLSAHGAVIMYTLNKDRTNDVLESLLSDVKFEIVRSKGEESVTDSFIQFDEQAMKVFSGYDHSTAPPNEVPSGSVVMDASFFEGTKEGQNPLKSMTDYDIVPEIFATYNGVKYPMNVTMSLSSFKTMREPAQVEVTNLLLAAGNLKFDVKVTDPDGAITGNSGHMIVMNLYQQDGTFVKAVRIPKNTKEPCSMEFKNLNVKAKFKLTFIAVEYNEGYTNTTFVSNKILKEILLSDSLNLSASIKLETLVGSTSNSKELVANTKIVFNDYDKILQSTPYSIQVKKNGVDITNTGGYPSEYKVDAGDYDTNKKIVHKKAFTVDKGMNTYNLLLYVFINGQKLELDSLTFTTEETIDSIGSAEEFIWKIKNNEGKGKYVVTDNISLESDANYANPDNISQTATPRIIVNTFDGKIDFQGYNLNYNYKTTGSQLFANLGPKSEIYNMVFEVKMENYNSAAYDSGALSRFNYGHIHDVKAVFKGGAGIRNMYFGLLCRINTVTGIIENFTVSNEPEEGLMPLTIRYEGGLCVGVNKGIIRNGYAYGDDIFTDIGSPSQGGAIRVGAIAGIQNPTGKIYNVYSLVNVVAASPAASSGGATYVSEYGSIVGNGGGKLNNAYGIGQSFFNQTYNGITFDKDKGPVSGTNNIRHKDVYYWNESNISYDKSPYQQMIGLESLHDYSWQAALLGGQFIASNVEVGYYPHVVQSDELPGQPYIPLPDRSNANLVEVMSTSVIEYIDNGQAAIVEFRFSNTKNAEIREISIENLTTEIDTESIVSADGYTTLRAKVSKAVRFCSAYEITQVQCYANGRLQKVTFNPNPILLVDFYRNIYNAQDWYDYVVSTPTENARLQADIDFTGVAENRIYVSKEFSGKIDGNKYRGETTGEPIGYTVRNISMKDTPNVFFRVTGEVKNLTVENLTMGTPEKAVPNCAFIKESYGSLNNIHMKNVSITGYSYLGGLVALSYAVSEVQDCSINAINITYTEPKNTNTNGRIGGLVGFGSEARITSSYVRDLTMAVSDIRNCEGAGGIIGYSNYCVIDGVYATGDMQVRGMNVGGIAGYYVAGETECSIKNIFSRVNIFSYQDKAGGIIGESGVGYVLNARNNISGVALGNVFANNPNAQNVSYTVGNLAGAVLSFYGTETQLLNGMTGQGKDENTFGLLTPEEMLDPEVYTGKAGMDRCYDYSKVTAGNLPVLYYLGTGEVLPFQTDTPLCMADVQNNEIEVWNVGINENNRYIYMDLINPKGYKITGLTIDNLKYTLDTASSNSARIYVDYLQASKQEHWQDSYLVTGISYQKVGSDGKVIIGKADYTDNPVRIPLTLFCDIRDCDDWNKYINENNNEGNYENYRIVNNMSFTGVVPTTNAKIGRLRGGSTNGKTVLSDLNIGPGYGTLKGNNENFIFRLNSELSNIRFENIVVNSAQRDCVGIIGTSAAEVDNVEFENISIDNRTAKKSNVGLIGYQLGGSLSNISLKNVRVGLSKVVQDNVSGLVGYATGGTLFQNIDGEAISVKGSTYVGGIVGGTGRISVDGVVLKDIKVSGDQYVGGVAGFNQSPIVSNKAPYFFNVSVTGTPSYDAGGNIIDSTTIVEGTGQFVGGLAGALYGYSNGYAGSLGNAKPLNVEGVIVKGFANYLGGAFGRCYNASNVTVKNSLITAKPKTQYYYAGGISGYHNYNNSYNLVENTTIDVENFSRVGLLSGYKANDATMWYNNVKDSTLNIKRTLTPGVYNDIGGLVGRSDGNVAYCGVIDSTVITDSTLTNAGYDNVGGVIGNALNGINRCYYYAKPESNNMPAAKKEYKVMGQNNTGGVAGWHEGGTVTLCYSNANVISKGHSAGGIEGVYQNAYNINMVNGKPVYAYSTVGLNNNYFAGTVHANKWAGGVIGRNEMSYRTAVAASHRENGGRNVVADAAGYKSGVSNENAYTYQNLVLAESVTSDEAGKANAFSGIMDGFEGRANGVSAAKDNTTADKARKTFFWEGMKVGGSDESNRIYFAENAAAPDWAKNGGTYRFKLWNQNEYKAFPKEEAPSDNYNVRLISTADLQDSLKMYRAFGWLTWTSSQTGNETLWKEANGTYNGDNIKGNYHRFITPRIVSSTLWNAVGDSEVYRGMNYLPHLRVNTNNGVIMDPLVASQSEYKIGIPLPTYTAAPRETIVPLMLARQTDTYAIVYPVDVDKINVEFSQDLVDSNVYFMLSQGSKQVDKQLITKRVYTYTYDYVENLKLEYGIGDTEEEIETAETKSYKAAALARHVMTYGTNYYYIDEDGIVYGTDSEGNKLPGRFIHIYNGKALTESGEIVDAASGESLGTVSGISILDNAMPVQAFDYNGFRIETYSKFAEAIEESVVARESQVLKGSTGVVGFVDGSLDNVKDSILLYTKNEDLFQTILGVDGIMVDMCQGGNINAPEDFKNSGIVYMTNNMNCTAPFVVVEYANGGMVGYNYMTGEYLFDKFVSNPMDILDYAKVYFLGDKSMYEKMSNSYAANKKVADIAGTSDRLLTMVEGNSTGKEIEDNSTGDGIESQHDKKALAEDSAKSEGDKGISQGDSDMEKNYETTEDLSSVGTAGDGLLEDSFAGQGGAGATAGGSEIAQSDLAAQGEGIGQGELTAQGEGIGQGELTAQGEGIGQGELAAQGEGTGQGELTAQGEGIGQGELTAGEDEILQGESAAKEDEKKQDEPTAEEEFLSPKGEEPSDEKVKGKEPEAADAEKKPAVSTAGTPVQDNSSGIKRGEKPKEYGSVQEEKPEAPERDNRDKSGTKEEGKLATVYNQSTGTYEIIDMRQYFSSSAYQSENVKLLVKDMSAYAGFAQVEEQKKRADGLSLYILVASASLAGIALTVRYRKRHKLK